MVNEGWAGRMHLDMGCGIDGMVRGARHSSCICRGGFTICDLMVRFRGAREFTDVRSVLIVCGLHWLGQIS